MAPKGISKDKSPKKQQIERTITWEVSKTIKATDEEDYEQKKLLTYSFLCSNFEAVNETDEGSDTDDEDEDEDDNPEPELDFEDD